MAFNINLNIKSLSSKDGFSVFNTSNGELRFSQDKNDTITLLMKGLLGGESFSLEELKRIVNDAEVLEPHTEDSHYTGEDIKNIIGGLNKFKSFRNDGTRSPFEEQVKRWYNENHDMWIKHDYKLLERHNLLDFAEVQTLNGIDMLALKVEDGDIYFPHFGILKVEDNDYQEPMVLGQEINCVRKPQKTHYLYYEVELDFSDVYGEFHPTHIRKVKRNFHFM